MTAHTIAISQLAVSSRSPRAHPHPSKRSRTIGAEVRARARAQDSASSVAFPREVAEHFFTGAATELGRSSKEEGREATVVRFFTTVPYEAIEVRSKLVI